MRPLGLAGWALLVAGCSDAGPEIQLEVNAPAGTEMVVGDMQRFGWSASGDPASVRWSSSDAQVAEVSLAGDVEALRPGVTTLTVSAADALSGTLELTVVPRPGGYTADEVDYFGAIAFGVEFGTAPPLLHRWRTNPGPTIRINGNPGPGDLAVLDSVLAEINRLTPLEISVVTDEPTVEMHFVPVNQFATVLPGAPPNNDGLVTLWWGADQYVYRSVILIGEDREDSWRWHLIREEVTQMLGLLMDSYRYTESIFYQGYSEVQEYLPVDRAVIELLYRAEMVPGMTRQEGMRVARRIVREPPVTAAPYLPGGTAPGATAPGAGVPGRGTSGQVSRSRFPPR